MSEPFEDFGCNGHSGVDWVGNDGHPGLGAVLGHARTQIPHYACSMQQHVRTVGSIRLSWGRGFQCPSQPHCRTHRCANADPNCVQRLSLGG